MRGERCEVRSVRCEVRSVGFEMKDKKISTLKREFYIFLSNCGEAPLSGRENGGELENTLTAMKRRHKVHILNLDLFKAQLYST